MNQTGRLTAVVGVLVLTMSVCGAQAQSKRTYRYEITTRMGDHEYREEIAAGAAVSGPSYQIERDKMGRMVRETDRRDGKATGVWEFHYTGLSKLPDSYETWLEGQLTAITNMQRNGAGVIVRYDRHTAQGDLTHYTVIEDLPDHQDTYGYTPDNKRTMHSLTYYSATGELVRRITYFSPESEAGFTDIEIDEHTGQTRSSKQVENGKLINTKKYTYTPDGGLSRVDAYDEKGTWYSADEFQNGLMHRRLYKFLGGESKEVRYSYDEKRWVTKSEVYFSDKLVCNLTYDREPDGTIRRTLATGLDGTLWGEYPAPGVMDVERNGQAVGRTDGEIHRSGNWW